jgi:hypothetical protein
MGMGMGRGDDDDDDAMMPGGPGAGSFEAPEPPDHQ